MEDIINITKRTEAAIFLELEDLCKSSGYIYCLAYICWQNGHVLYNQEITPNDTIKLSSSNGFTNSEISTLIGLIIKNNIDFTLPDENVFRKYIHATTSLLEELHKIIEPTIPFSPNGTINFNLFKIEQRLRGAIIYGPETTYSFQYDELALEKYKNDFQWFLENRNFTPDNVSEVIECIQNIQQEKFDNLLFIKKNDLNNYSKFEDFLAAFILTKKEICEKSALSVTIIESILNSFCISAVPANLNFNKVDDLNEINFCPLILISKDQTFILFQFYRLTQSLYESPFYWMLKDKKYCKQADINRGIFTEKFTAKKLRGIFGTDKVFENVTIENSSKVTLGEIDVLVVYADRIIICQAKSKKLTHEARQGNLEVLKKDFKEAIQAGYNQGLKCAKFILENKYIFYKADGDILNLQHPVKDIFVFSVISEFYPSLTFQVNNFLNFEKHQIVKSPCVMEVFFLDILCEFLPQPLQFLHYISERTALTNKITMTNEGVILSLYLSNNLAAISKLDYAWLDDGLSNDIIQAMIVRKMKIPGNPIPKGILTQSSKGIYGEIISQISRLEKPEALDFGFFLLNLDEKAVDDINAESFYILKKTKRENKLNHFSFPKENSGISIYTTLLYNEEIFETALNHSRIQKYQQKADRWFGIFFNPNFRQFKFFSLNFNWKKDEEWEKSIEIFPDKPYKN